MRRYTKFIALVAALGLGLGAQADTKSDSLLKALADKMESHHTYKVDFSVEASEQMPKTSGSFIVSADYYYIEVSGVEVFYNGEIRETYNRRDNELIVESNIPDHESLMINPTNIFKLYGSDFNHRMTSSSDPRLEAIEMTPIDKKYSPMVVYLDKTTGLAAKVTMEVENTQIVFSIDKITFDVGVDTSTFNFDRSKHKNVEIINY